ncbi:MAG TPA: cell division topological specificity factor MinE [Anaerolineales bacterium]|nr:cell division topological specificity factor MinE [Anaerolineales bacterium]
MKLFGLFNKPKSAGSAKDRLRLVLINDRINISPATISALKDELIAVISKYVDIDPQFVHVQIDSDGRTQKLVADIPIRSNSKKR